MYLPTCALSCAQTAAIWRAYAKAQGEGGSCRIVLGHNEQLSHRVFAAADMLLVPSIFEPCGLTQVRGPGKRVWGLGFSHAASRR